MAARLQQGSIVWVTISDPNGKNPKERPAVIVTATAEITDDKPIVVVAITSKLKKPLPPAYVKLPWHRSGHPRTGLKMNCAAQCGWLIAILPKDIKNVAGIVPAAQLLEVLARIPKPPSQESTS